MYTFIVCFPDDTERFYQIEKVQYLQASQPIEVSGDEIFSHAFPTSCDLHLYSNTKHTIVSPKNIIKIEIIKAS